MTDEELIRRAGRGDEAAFLLLYERHRTPVFRFACRMLGSAAQAEDITHDCFLGLIREPARFDPARAALRTYLYAAARNLAFKHFRGSAGHVPLDELDAATHSTPERDGPLRALLSAELSEEVRRAVAQLPPLQREVVVLFEYEGLSLAEVAEVVGADTGAVKSRLHRARERLRRSLSLYFKSAAGVAPAGKVCK